MFTPIKSAAFLIAAISTLSLATVFMPKTAFAADPTAPAATCTDATDASNLSVVWNGGSSITVKTKSGLPVCAPVTVNYSTYTMPDNYDGNGFYSAYQTLNPTAFPQVQATTFSFVLDMNTYGTWLQNVPAADVCTNTQADLYYGEPITGINGDGYGVHADGSHATTDADSVYGHAAQNIASQIFTRDASACTPGQGAGTPVSEGGKGSGTLTTSTPTVLPDTGVDVRGTVFSGIAAMVLGAMGMFALGIRALRR